MRSEVKGTLKVIKRQNNKSQNLHQDSLRKKHYKTKTNKPRDTEIGAGRQNRNWHISSKITRLTFLYIWSFFTHPILASFLCGEFLLHIPFWLHFSMGFFSYTSRAGFIFSVGSFSYTSRAGFIFISGVSLTHPVLDLFLPGKFLLHILCWLLLFFFFNLVSFSYTPRTGFMFMREGSLTHPVLAFVLSGEFLLHIPCFLAAFFFFFFFFSVGSSLTRPMLALFLSGEFLLHIPCWLHFYQGPGSYTSGAGFIFIWGVSLTHPGLASFLCGEFLIHIPCCLQFYAGNFFYAFRAGFFFFNLFLSGEFLLFIPCWFNFYRRSFSYTSRAGFIFMRGVFLTHPLLFFVVIVVVVVVIWGFSLTHLMLVFFFFSSFFLFIWGVSLTVTHPVLFLFFIWGVSLTVTQPVLFLFLSVVFLLHGSCWFLFYMGSFSYTSHAVFVVAVVVFKGFLLHIPCLILFYVGITRASLVCSLLWRQPLKNFKIFCGEFLLHIPCWLGFYLGSFFYTSHACRVFFFFFSFLFFFFSSFLYLGTSRAGFLLHVESFSGMQSSLKTTPKEMSRVEDGPGKKRSEKVTLKTEKEPYKTLYRAEQTQTRTGWQMAIEKKGE